MDDLKTRIETQLRKSLAQAMDQTEQKLTKLAHDDIAAWYADYTPVMYKRNYSFMKALNHYYVGELFDCEGEILIEITPTVIASYHPAINTTSNKHLFPAHHNSYIDIINTASNALHGVDTHIPGKTGNRLFQNFLNNFNPQSITILKQQLSSKGLKME